MITNIAFKGHATRRFLKYFLFHILVFPVERRFRHEPSFRGPGREHQ